QEDHRRLEKVDDLIAKHGRLHRSTMRQCRQSLDSVLECTCCRRDAFAVRKTRLLLSRGRGGLKRARAVPAASGLEGVSGRARVPPELRPGARSSKFHSTKGVSVTARREADLLAEPARKMALIRESGRTRNLRKGHIGCGQELLRSSHATSHQILVRRHAFRLFECASEARYRQARDTGQHFQADIMFQVGIDVFAYALPGPRRQTRAQRWA